MHVISDRERASLAALRICEVDDPILRVCRHIPHKGRRVLIPLGLAHLFEALPSVGGTMKPNLVRETIEIVARAKIGTTYRRSAGPGDAPYEYSCSTFTRAIFAFMGIHLSRYAIDQSYQGHILEEPCRACLAFWENQFPIRDSDRSIGHVGLVTEHTTVIHGLWTRKVIVEEPLWPARTTPLFVDIVPEESSLLIQVPTKIQGIETALDLARFLQRPPRTS